MPAFTPIAVDPVVELVAARASLAAIAATPRERAAVRRAAAAILDYERWATATSRRGDRQGYRRRTGRPTAEQILDEVVGGDVRRWASLAQVAFALANVERGHRTVPAHRRAAEPAAA
ncbi:MAG TPA: hypothetical protein VK837_06610 [Longimicrobiales bacterium]|nr:hypothetical protein [Longimicrobiales bacterium]